MTDNTGSFRRNQGKSYAGACENFEKQIPGVLHEEDKKEKNFPKNGGNGGNE